MSNTAKLKTFRGFVKDLKKIYEKHQQLKDFGFALATASFAS